MKRREFIALLGGRRRRGRSRHVRNNQSGFPVSDSWAIQLRRSRLISLGRSARACGSLAGTKAETSSS